MENITLIIISIATLLNAVLAIYNFVSKIRNGSKNVIDKKFQIALSPLEQKIDKIDENQCRNFLVDFLADIENGVEKDEVQIKRAYEVYEHYTNDLHKNSYIHDKWEKLMK
ncbi:MAG: hypothetical protein HFJ30_09985 [Clostridia bacterium]|nr:hypothetical protein [Clostridia bacterium]